MQSNSLPSVSSEAERFLRVVSSGCFVFVTVGRESLKQCATGVAHFDVQEIIRRCGTLLRTAVEPESQISGGRCGNCDRLVSLSRHIVIYAEINVARPAVRVIAVAGVKGAGTGHYPRRHAAFEPTIDDQLSGSSCRRRRRRRGCSGSRSSCWGCCGSGSGCRNRSCGWCRR